MDLSQLAKKTELIKLTLDSEEIIAKYKEPIEFYTYDSIPLDKYALLSKVRDSSDAIRTLHDLILDKDGKPVIQGDRMIPPLVLTEALAAITKSLEK